VGAAAQTVGPVYAPGNGLVNPRPTYHPDPIYTEAALQARTQGVVILEGTVTPAGQLVDLRILQSLDAGLDQEAIRTAQLWRFTPGTKDGTPVNVRVTMQLQFSLGRQSRPSTPDATGVYTPGPGVTSPVVTKHPDPKYPDGESRSGKVILEATVQTDGTVADLKVIQSFDEEPSSVFATEALRTLKAWQFTPGKVNGVAVPVRVTVELSFTKKE
jgi:TonB family protein